MDATVKCCHYESCGTASRNIAPRMNTYFEAADQRVGDLIREGSFNLAAVSGRGGAGGVEGGEDGVERGGDEHCTGTTLVCGWPDSSSADGAVPVDRHGIVGAVCRHGIPLRGLFTDLRTPEQFSYYLVLLEDLLKSVGGDLEPGKPFDVFIDFGYRLKSSRSRFLAGAGRYLREEHGAGNIRIMVNWLHAASHNLSCQLQNNGRYIEGTGRRRQEGEGTKRLWGGRSSCIPYRGRRTGC